MSLSLIQKIIRPEILVQTPYHVPDASNLIKLDAMENPYDLPKALKDKLAAHLAAIAMNRYPIPSYTALKQKICHHFGIPEGYNVLLGNGSDELISMLSVACAKPGAKVLAPVPTFVMYAMSAQFAGMQFIGVPLQTDLSLDMTAMLSAIQQHRPALVYLANPNNPTGHWMNEDHLIQIIKAMENIGLVVVDEAYQIFAPISMMFRLPEFSHLIVMRTVSKIGMAGLRLGYLSAAPQLLSELEKVRPPYNVNVLTAAAVEFLLDHMAIFYEQAKTICAQRSLLISELQRLNYQVYPTATNFVLFKAPDAKKIFNHLLEHKILIKNVSAMHSLLNNCLRVTVGTPEQNQLFIQALAEVK